ncbi:MAG: hypothetical protein RLZZ15_1197 [Verrucomicrobiota bacterium]|jgi:hypothetical protein
MQLVSSLDSAKPTWGRFFGTLAVAAVCVAGVLVAVAQPAPPAHLVKGLQLADEIAGAQHAGVFADANNVSLNRYGGVWNSATDPSFIRFADFANGVLPANHTRCAPLVTHLLKACYNWNWSAHSFYDPLLKITKSSASPAPYQYIALLKAGKGFAARLTRLDQALPGDLLLWWNVGTDAGDHAMIVVAIDAAGAKAYPSEFAAAKPELAGTTYYAVTVLDSSSGLHTDDSRLVPVNGVDTPIAGLGTGTVGVLVNANSEIVGTTWSLPTANFTTQKDAWLNGLHSRLKMQTTTEALIGRLP